MRLNENGSLRIGDAATVMLYAAHSEGDDLVIGGSGWRGMTILGEGGGGVIQFADTASNRIGQILYNHGDNSMMFRTNGNVDRLRISSNGDVRIGSGTPATFGSGTTVLETYNASTYTANLVTSGTHQLQMIASQTHGATSIGTRSNHNLNLCVNDSTKVSITTGGEVNIGGNYTQTTAPLCVTTSANNYGIRLQSGSNVVCEILNNDSAGNSEIRGYYNNNSGTRGEGYRLEANGNTFFNPAGSNRTFTITNATVGVGESELYITSSASYATHFNYQDNGSHYISVSNSGACNFRKSSSGGTLMIVHSNGGIGGGGSTNNIYNPSDERLKENMVELTNGLDKIKKLKPYSFTWKKGFDETLDGVTQYGFGAHQAKTVDEKLVEKFIECDIELNGETIKDPLRVNEKHVIPLLVKAIQEQQEQIEILKSEVAALKG